MGTFPAHSRTYYTDTGYDTGVPANGTDAVRRTWWAIKACLKKEIMSENCGPVPAWTCAGSSDGTTAGMDGVDRWMSTYTADRINGGNSGNAHSWIVLYNSTIGVWLTFDVPATLGNLLIYVSYAAPTGGSITARPTNANEAQIWQTLSFHNQTRRVLHRVFTSDGHFHLFTTKIPNDRADYGQCLAVWPCTDMKPTDNYPWFAWAGNYIRDGSVTGLWRNGTIKARTGAGTFQTMTPGVWMAYGSSASLLFWDNVTWGKNFNGEWEYGPFYLQSQAPATVKGRPLDMYQGSSTWTNNGGAVGLCPIDGPPTHIGIGLIWLPFTKIPLLY